MKEKREGVGRGVEKAVSSGEFPEGRACERVSEKNRALEAIGL